MRESVLARSPSASSFERALPTLPASYPRTRYLTTDNKERERNAMRRRGWMDGRGGKGRERERERKGKRDRGKSDLCMRPKAFVISYYPTAGNVISV